MLTFSEYFIQGEEIRLNTIFRYIKVHLNYFSMLVSTIHHRLYYKNAPTLPQRAFTVCVSLLSIISTTFFSLASAYILVMLQVMTVRSGQRDK